MMYAQIETHRGMEIARDSYVENLLVMDPSQKGSMEAALGKPLLEASPLGLLPGDLYNGVAWTRNVDGEQVVLPIETPSTDAEEALRILRGEVE